MKDFNYTYCEHCGANLGRGFHGTMCPTCYEPMDYHFSYDDSDDEDEEFY